LLLRILAEHRREVEGWMEQQQSKLQDALLQACAEAVSESPPASQSVPFNSTATSERSHATSSRKPESTGRSISKLTRRYSFEESPLSVIWQPEQGIRTPSKLLRRHSEVGLEVGSFRWELHMMMKGHLGLFIGVLILLSSLLTFVELEFHGTGEHALVFDICTHGLTVVFVMELAVRLYVYRVHYFRSSFNLLDGIVVMLTCLDTWVLSYMQYNVVNISFLRLVRFVRVARALRVMRALSLFQNLRVLVNAIFMSMPSLFWSMLVLFVFMLSSSLFLCQMLQDFIANEKDDNKDTVDWVKQHYGTSSKALYTVFELTLSGCWPNYARRLIEEVNVGYAAFFVFYVTCVVFAMIRIISALFLKDTLTSTANDDELMCSERSKEINAFKAKLAALFNDADHSEDGYLDRTELEWLLEHPNVKVWMSALGLDVRNAMELFELLDDGDGYVSQFEFLDGITRLRGSARSQDLFILMRTTQSILDQCDSLRSSNQSLHAALGVPPPQSPPQRLRFGACGTPSLSKPTAAQGP